MPLTSIAQEKISFFNQNEKISYSQGLTLTQPLFRGGIIIGGINIAKLTLSKSFFEYLEEKK